MAGDGEPRPRRAVWTWLEAAAWVLLGIVVLVGVGRPLDEWRAVHEPRVVRARIEAGDDGSDGFVWVRVGESGRRTEVDLTGTRLPVSPGGTLLVRDHGDTTIPADVTMARFLRADVPAWAMLVAIVGIPAWWLRRRRRRHPSNRPRVVLLGRAEVVEVPLATWPFQRRAWVRVSGGRVEVRSPTLWGSSPLQAPIDRTAVARFSEPAERRRALADIADVEVLARPLSVGTPVPCRGEHLVLLFEPPVPQPPRRQQRFVVPGDRQLDALVLSLRDADVDAAERLLLDAGIARAVDARAWARRTAGVVEEPRARDEVRAQRRRERALRSLGAASSVTALLVFRLVPIWHLPVWSFGIAAIAGATAWWALRAARIPGGRGR